MNRAAAGARVNGFEVTLTPRRGPAVCVSCTVQPAARLLPGGQALWWILRDVTERRRADEAERLLAAERAARRAAERAEARLAQVLEATSDAFFSLDAEGRFTYVNEGAGALWGIDRVVPGRLVAEAFPAADDSVLAGAPALALGEGHAVRAEAWSPLAGRWVEVNAFPTRRRGRFPRRAGPPPPRRRRGLLAEAGEALGLARRRRDAAAGGRSGGARGGRLVRGAGRRPRRADRLRRRAS